MAKYQEGDVVEISDGSLYVYKGDRQLGWLRGAPMAKHNFKVGDVIEHPPTEDTECGSRFYAMVVVTEVETHPYFDNARIKGRLMWARGTPNYIDSYWEPCQDWRKIGRVEGV